MPRVQRADIERIADLARLDLSADRADRMTADIEAILGYVAKLEALDTAGIEPTTHAVPLATPLRDDRAVPPLDPELALANAPARDGFAFVVPKVLDEDEA
jgi:aspartyl-tRNA(Asn)/glutamyl-tRNA(Gln) amidotransferase subunit C